MQKRNYQKERKYDSKPSVMKKRANRNAARYKMIKTGKVKKYDGKDVHHVGGNALKRNSKLKAVSASANRSYARTKNARKLNSKSQEKDMANMKAVPAGAKGLSKLPTAVRNKMGYMKNGGMAKNGEKAMMKKKKGYAKGGMSAMAKKKAAMANGGAMMKKKKGMAKGGAAKMKMMYGGMGMKKKKAMSKGGKVGTARRM